LPSLRPQAARVAALGAIVLIGLATRLPSVSLGEPARVQQRFSFHRSPLASVPVAGFHRIRRVEPSLRRISAWISAVGAAVTLADVDGNGRPDDVCLVDPRTDTVTVSPAPGTPARYGPFVLSPAPLPFDRSSTAPMGCLPGDFNEDGRLDLLVYYWGRTPILFLRRPGRSTGSAAFVRQELVRPVARWYTDSIDAADVDGDGHVDLIVGNYFPDGSRILDPHARRDPKLALQDSMSRALNGGVDHILLWAGSRAGARPAAAFQEARGALSPAVAHGWTLAIGAYDLDGDGRPELYFANDFGPDRLLANESTPGHVRLVQRHGRSGFFVPKSKVLGNDSFKGMGVDFADMNGDGRPDIFVSNITTRFGLMESNFAWVNDGGSLHHGSAPFADRSEALGLSRSGWGWDAKFGDFDADGVPELVQATGFVKGKTNLWPQIAELAMESDPFVHDIRSWPNFGPGSELAGRQSDNFFVRARSGRWANANGFVGLDDHEVSRGLATADVNTDGRLDFAIARQWVRSYLYVNRCRACGRSLELRLLLPPSSSRSRPLRVRPGGAGDRLVGSPAVGAAVQVIRPDGRRVEEQVDGGNGHASVRSPELFFGLGNLSRTAPLAVRIAWRDRDGVRRRTALRLTPGRWSVVLGAAR
jgi:enediyne biosynthesis protein E4